MPLPEDQPLFSDLPPVPPPVVASATLADIDRELAELRNHPGTSHWLLDALDTALRRDPLDAAGDAEALASLLSRRADALLASHRRGGRYGAG